MPNVYADSPRKLTPLTKSGTGLRGNSKRKSGKSEEASIETRFDDADVAFEQRVVETTERLWYTQEWQNPLGGRPGPLLPFRLDRWSFFARWFNYWTLRHEKNTHAYLQPVDDVYNKINSSWFDGMKLFSSIFGISLMELTLSRAPTAKIGRTWAWAASTACFGFAAPLMLAMIPVVRRPGVIGFVRMFFLFFVARSLAPRRCSPSPTRSRPSDGNTSERC